MNRPAIFTLASVVASGVIAEQETFTGSNLSPITWEVRPNGTTRGDAELYPSEINISGAAGAILDVNVTLLDGAHTAFSDLELVLLSPSGTAIVLSSRARFNDPLEGDLTFDDEADSPIGAFALGAPVNGTWQTADYGIGTNAPFEINAERLTAFDDESANGNWGLYAYDAVSFDGGNGSIAGWRIEILTVPSPSAAALVGIGCLASVRRRR